MEVKFKVHQVVAFDAEITALDVRDMGGTIYCDGDSSDRGEDAAQDIVTHFIAKALDKACEELRLQKNIRLSWSMATEDNTRYHTFVETVEYEGNRRITLPSLAPIGYSIISLYNEVAKTLRTHYWNDESIRFDCTKIHVAENIYQHMKNMAIATFCPQHDEITVRTDYAMLWCISGPKTSPNLLDNEVEIEEGFISFT